MDERVRPQVVAVELEFLIGEYLYLVHIFECQPPHIKTMMCAYPPGSEWMKRGDTTGDWYIPSHYNDDGTMNMIRVCLRCDVHALEDNVFPSELVPLVTH